MGQEESAQPGDTGTQPAIPQKPLSAEEFRNALVEQALSRPQVLGEQEYRDQLEATLLASHQRAAALLDEVRGYLEQLGAQQQGELTLGAGTGAAGQAAGRPEDLTLAIDKLDAAHAAFQYAAMWHHWQIGSAASVLSEAPAADPVKLTAEGQS